MKFDKVERILIVISSIVYIAYIVFIGGMINSFKNYVGNEYLRTRIVDQIREQTKLTRQCKCIYKRFTLYFPSYGTIILVILCYVSITIFIVNVCYFKKGNTP